MLPYFRLPSKTFKIEDCLNVAFFVKRVQDQLIFGTLIRSLYCIINYHMKYWLCTSNFIFIIMLGLDYFLKRLYGILTYMI